MIASFSARLRVNPTRLIWPFTREAMLDALLASQPRFVAFYFPFSTCKTTCAGFSPSLDRVFPGVAYIY